MVRKYQHLARASKGYPFKEIFKLRYSVRKFALPPPIQGSGGESKLDDLSIAWQEKLGQPKTRHFAALLVRR